MKKIVTFVALLISVISLVSCSLYEKEIEGSKDYTTKTFTLDDADSFEFENVKVKNKSTYLPTIEMYPGLEKSIEIYTDTTTLEHITVKIKNSEIKIYGDRKEVYITEHFDVKIYGYVFDDIDISTANIKSLTYSPSNLSLDLSGAAICKIAPMICNELELDISGASLFNSDLALKELSLDISGASSFTSALAVDRVNLDISGASDVDLSGLVTDLVVDMSGASKLDSKSLVSQDVEVEISGASDAKITFVSSLKGEISGASDLIYYGDSSKVDVKTSGASDVDKG